MKMATNKQELSSDDLALVLRELFTVQLETNGITLDSVSDWVRLLCLGAHAQARYTVVCLCVCVCVCVCRLFQLLKDQ